MKLTFYHYVHCPYCVRVRMALGHFNRPYQSQVLPYNDEETPIKLTGKKMLPIMLFGNTAINESLDIIAKLDTENVFRVKEIESSSDFKIFNELLTKLGSNVHNLAMPYWIWTPEFNEQSRQYFKAKKEAKRGPFQELMKKKDQFIQDISQDLSEVAQDLKPFYRSENFSLYDILLASHLWGLYVVPEFQFSEKMHLYLQSVKKQCRFEYHQDFWR